jgi:hypothetical protein
MFNLVDEEDKFKAIAARNKAIMGIAAVDKAGEGNAEGKASSPTTGGAKKSTSAK